MASLGLLAVLVAGVVYAAASASFTVSVAPTSQTVNKGSKTSYVVKVNRKSGFTGPVALRASSLPAGTTAAWHLSDGTTSNIVPADQTSAKLTLKTSNSTPTGSFSPRITGTSGSTTSSATVALKVLGAGQRNFTLDLSPWSQRTFQGDTTAKYTVNISRFAGFEGSLALAVSGLPAGASARWIPSPPTVPGSSSTAALEISTQSATPAGTYLLTIKGTGAIGGNSVTRSTAAALTVQKTVPITVSGGPAGQLAPGVKRPLDLTLTNPYDFSLKVTSLKAALREATNGASCSRSANFALTQLPASAYPITLPPGSSELSALVPSASLPTVEMLDLATNQDGCKGAQLKFDYSGGGTK